MTYAIYLAITLQVILPYKVKYVNEEIAMNDLAECVEVMVTFHEEPSIVDKDTVITDAECVIKKIKQPEVEDDVETFGPPPSILDITQPPPMEHI